jgi:hypothetical protein
MARGKKFGGRTKGTPNKRTVEKQSVAIERQERALASGASPLEVMVDDMRFHHSAALAELERGSNADHAKVAASLAAARAAAKDAAPYVHPRLASIEHMGAGGGAIEFTNARDKLALLLAGEAAARDADEHPVTSH